MALFPMRDAGLGGDEGLTLKALIELEVWKAWASGCLGVFMIWEHRIWLPWRGTRS